MKMSRKVFEALVSLVVVVASEILVEDQMPPPPLGGDNI